MRKYVWIIVSLFILELIPSACSAQYVIKVLPRWMFSTHLDYMLPQSPVDRFLDADDWGYRFEFQYRLQYNKPFLAGLYLSEAGLSKYELNYILYDPDGAISVREKANTRRLEFGLTAGFYPEINWLLQPYVQGRVGMAVYQSSSILTDDDSDENIERISEMTSSVLAYGMDFGIHIVPNIWYLRGDVRVGFVANPSGTFLSLNEENAGSTGHPIEYFEQHTSSANWLKFSVGLSYLF
ncbi:MAG: hypothetical protein IPL92_18795 [Saprospiraceae bacterium]|nr:hypothetical protein [Candidatus Opimibacter iunctus]